MKMLSIRRILLNPEIQVAQQHRFLNSVLLCELYAECVVHIVTLRSRFDSNIGCVMLFLCQFIDDRPDAFLFLRLHFMPQSS